MDRRTRDRRELSRMDRNLDREVGLSVEIGRVGRASRSVDAVNPDGGRDPSGVSGNGREMRARSRVCLGLGAVENLGEREPNIDRRRLLWRRFSGVVPRGSVVDNLLRQERPSPWSCSLSPGVSLVE